jgi:hypothetical protein
LSGVDVMSALRRMRLPLVVSLFLAALLGAPISAGPVFAPVPAPVVITVAAPAVRDAAPAVLEDVIPEPPVSPAAPARRVVTDAPVLTDQVSTAATAPRGPPRTA